MSSVPPPTSYPKATLTALGTTWQATKEVATSHVLPVLKQIAAKISLVWEAAVPVLQKIMESKLGLSIILLGLAVVPLTLAQMVKKNMLATTILFSIGLILTAGGFSFLFSTGILPGALTNITLLS